MKKVYNLLDVVRLCLLDTLRILRLTLQEIFDEAAYARFLQRAGMISSSKSYAAFRKEFEEAKMRRPKCC